MLQVKHRTRKKIPTYLSLPLNTGFSFPGALKSFLLSMCHSLTSTPVLNPSNILQFQFFVNLHSLSSPFIKAYDMIFIVSVISGDYNFAEGILANAAL